MVRSALRLRGVALMVVAGLVVLLPGPAAAAPARTDASAYPAHTAYVERVYADLLDRAPDQVGAQHWTNLLVRGTSLNVVANAITSSTEYRSRLIRQVYADFLGRAPDAEGLVNWLGAMASGLTVAQIESGFIASAEFYAAAGSSPSGWVTALYREVLDRTPGPSEVEAWTGAIAAGASRSQVALGFLLSTEHLSTVVDGYYQDLLGRALDPSGKATWVGILQAGGRDEAIIAGIVSSLEYWNRATAAAPPQVVAGRAYTTQTRAGEYGVPELWLTYQGTVSTYQVRITSGVTYSVDGHPEACGGSGCTMTVAGRYALTATYEGATYPGEWDVVPGQAATVTISPSDVSVAYWESVRLNVSGVDIYGNPYRNGHWEWDDDAMVRDQSTGGFRSTVAGDHRATATVDGLTATATVHVAAPGPAGYRLYTWGDDEEGQLGIGGNDQNPHPTPTEVGPDNRWLKVSAGGGHVIAIRTDGTLWGWGSNYIGQGGIEDRLDHSAPMRVGTATNWQDVCASEDASYGLRTDGTLWIWGATFTSNGNPQLWVEAPRRMDAETDWTGLGCGGYTFMATKADGSLWMSGEVGGVVGDDSKGRHLYYTGFYQAADRAGPFTAASLGASHYVLALRPDNTLWSWGSRDFGQLGVSNIMGLDQPPLQVGTDTWQYVDAGDGVSSAIRSDGTLWQWGAIGSPCTLTDTSGCVTVPQQVGTGTSWRAVHTVRGNGALLDSGGGLWTWGNNTHGQLGDGTTTDRSTPTRIEPATGWTSFDLGDERSFTVALRP